jgi:periplasmic divalent cation tolerance protein
MADEYVIVLTTLPVDADAPAFARTLVSERLAACINVPGEITSVYWWEGELSQEVERQIVMKTTRAKVGPLWDRVRDLHPYDVPEFVVLPIIDGSDAYLRWIGDSTTEERPPDERPT